MSSLFTNYFGIQNAKNFEQFVTSVYGNTYITIGRNIPWPNNDDPPTPTESANSFYTYWDNLIGIKKITAADMNLVIPRVDWDATGQTIYTAYTQDLDIFKKTTNAQVQYDYKFYVRNNKDQVFKCLANTASISSTTPVKSTVMPEITLGGQLPENPFIQTTDGYKWKYMYTIAAGLKERFFTKEYMPVNYDPVVVDNASAGRLDIFKIVKRGGGYNDNITAYSLPIAEITGNGTGARITLQAITYDSKGANIYGVNIVNPGIGYTKASVTIKDPLKEVLTEEADIQAVIGPPGGHGSDVARELGASNIMISVDIENDESGILPIGSNDVHGIRQIGILLDPQLTTGEFAHEAVYRATTRFDVTTTDQDYIHNQLVYSGETIANATFKGYVEHFDPVNKYIFVTEIDGIPAPYKALYGVYQGNEKGIISSILNIEESKLKKYTGKLLYIEDTSEIKRTMDQIIRFKFTLRF